MGVAQENYNNVKEYNAYDENQYHIYYAGEKDIRVCKLQICFVFTPTRRK